MIYYILAGVIGMFGISLLIIAVYLSSSSSSFEQNKQFGKAEVVGHDYAEGAAWPTLLVRLVGVEHEGMYTCHARNNYEAGKLPNGTIIDVEYAQKQALGHIYYEVHMRGDQQKPKVHNTKAIKIISYLLLAIALGILTAGLFLK